MAGGCPRASGAAQRPVYTFPTRCESVLCGDSPQVSPLAERPGAIPGPPVTVRQRWRFGALA